MNSLNMFISESWQTILLIYATAFQEIHKKHFWPPSLKFQNVADKSELNQYSLHSVLSPAESLTQEVA